MKATLTSLGISVEQPEHGGKKNSQGTDSKGKREVFRPPNRGVCEADNIVGGTVKLRRRASEVPIHHTDDARPACRLAIRSWRG